MSRFIYIALLSLIGFCLTPSETYACGSKSENTENTYSKKSDTEKENKAFCDTEKGQCNNHGKDCDGKCGNPNCHCPTYYANFTVPFFVQFSGIKLNPNKPNFYYQESFYSSGFISIWLPPKIG
ncbi:MAG: hypothetical protein IPI59_00175 [Sphingobacteriales bacterium]|jgi:hypothetical protein|nr:hypothetical protein [Sphingobacteriales bacterium]MDA0199587.1 hypothetical protein [Bacteroidota bacterium]MBK6890957.1 hypothetical protein [Sphingobacteriales bacterium]MBK7525992.1 hypothetical protein [Sphingobacteriales bacterium]MBK8677704.1 hypothetical protein [Sphingobacteriales bacterium]